MAKVHLYSLCHTWLNLRRLSDRQTAISYQASLIITAASQYSDTVSRIEKSCKIEKLSSQGKEEQSRAPEPFPPPRDVRVDCGQCGGGGGVRLSIGLHPPPRHYESMPSHAALLDVHHAAPYTWIQGTGSAAHDLIRLANIWLERVLGHLLFLLFQQLCLFVFVLHCFSIKPCEDAVLWVLKRSEVTT